METILAMTEALLVALNPAITVPRIKDMRELTKAVWNSLLPYIVSGLVLPTGPNPAASDRRVPHHVSLCVLGADRSELITQMEGQGILVSGGSACTSDSPLPSHVLSAMGIPMEYARGSLRITLSHLNTKEEVNTRLIPALQQVLDIQRKKRQSTAP